MCNLSKQGTVKIYLYSAFEIAKRKEGELSYPLLPNKNVGVLLDRGLERENSQRGETTSHEIKHTGEETRGRLVIQNEKQTTVPLSIA